MTVAPGGVLVRDGGVGSALVDAWIAGAAPTAGGGRAAPPPCTPPGGCPHVVGSAGAARDWSPWEGTLLLGYELPLDGRSVGP